MAIDRLPCGPAASAGCETVANKARAVAYMAASRLLRCVIEIFFIDDGSDVDK